MNGEITGLVKSIEFLLKMLHTEWDRTGASEASVLVSAKELKLVSKEIQERLESQKMKAEADEYHFKKYIVLTHENYILLRLGRKLKAYLEKEKTGGSGQLFQVLLDKEELELYDQILHI